MRTYELHESQADRLTCRLYSKIMLLSQHPYFALSDFRVVRSGETKCPLRGRLVSYLATLSEVFSSVVPLQFIGARAFCGDLCRLYCQLYKVHHFTITCFSNNHCFPIHHLFGFIYDIALTDRLLYLTIKCLSQKRRIL